jgi:hypothetical protein
MEAIFPLLGLPDAGSGVASGVCMFQRGRADRTDSLIGVEITTEDGHELKGNLVVAIGRSLTEMLNGPASFVEFEPLRGERLFIAKSALQYVKPIHVVEAPKLGSEPRELGPFNPFTVLGVSSEASQEQVHAAYLNLAKTYHPDRYAAAELPLEVHDYLAAMSRRINAAYADLVTKQEKQVIRQEPVFTKSGRS